jgi:hypothetical protein
MAEGGPLPPVDPERLAAHERRLALAFPRPGTFRVLAVTKDGGEWSVDLDLADLDEEVVRGDPAAVRFVILADGDAFTHDLPVEVLQRLADRIREL